MTTPPLSPANADVPPPRLMLGLSWPLVVALLALTGTMVSRQVLADPDTYWHLATGQWILSHHAIPMRDVFSHSMPGAEWTAHEWASEIIITLVQRLGGWAGLQFLTGLSFAATLAYMTRFLLRRLEPVHALMFVLVSAAMIYSHLLARPHVLVWPLTAVWVGELIRSSEENVAPPWWLLLLLVAWANLHASFTLGVGLAGAIALDAVAQAPDKAARVIAVRRWGVFLAACSGCVLLNPQGYHAITYAVQVMGMKITLDLVNEWKSPDFHEPQALLIWLFCILALALSGRLKLPWVRTIMILGLLYLGLKHQRYHDLIGLVSPFVLATQFASSVYAGSPPVSGATTLDKWFRAMARPARATGVTAALILAIVIGAGFMRLRDIHPIDGTTPAAALDAAERAGVRGNVFNAYNFGGYLIYRGVPVFIDGRSDMYGDSLMQETLNAVLLKKPGSLEATLSRYHISWTMLAPSTAAVQLLDRLPEWKRIYGDSIAVVHVRRDSAVVQGQKD